MHDMEKVIALLQDNNTMLKKLCKALLQPPEPKVNKKFKDSNEMIEYMINKFLYE